MTCPASQTAEGEADCGILQPRVGMHFLEEVARDVISFSDHISNTCTSFV